MSDYIFAVVMIAATVYLWRAAVLTTWRGDQRSALVRRRDAPVGYPFGNFGWRAQARAIAPSGMLVAVLALGAVVQAVMVGHSEWVAEHWVVLPAVIATLVAAAVVTLVAWPKSLIPPLFRKDEGAVQELLRRLSRPR